MVLTQQNQSIEPVEVESAFYQVFCRLRNASVAKTDPHYLRSYWTGFFNTILQYLAKKCLKSGGLEPFNCYCSAVMDGVGIIHASKNHLLLTGGPTTTGHISKDTSMQRMLGTFHQYVPMILSNNYWCQSKPRSLLDTGMDVIP